MYSRNLASAVLKALEDTPVVFLAGGRQTGKTTLAKGVARAPHPARYLALDDPTLREAAAADPGAFLADLGGPVVLDEVQQAPELFQLLRQEVDRDRTPGRFLLTGSAQVLATPRLAEALVGRMETLRLWPLSQGEIAGVREGFADAVFGKRLPRAPDSELSREDLWSRALAGGFPEAFSRAPARRSAWLKAYVEHLLARDVRDLATIEKLDSLPRLLELVAARAGSLLNFAELSRTAGLPQSTLKRYFALLEGVFLVARVPAWARTPTKRLTKSPKLFLVDPALLGHLNRLNRDVLVQRPASSGPLLESLVAVELSKQLGWSAVARRLYHFRTSTGAEVDFVLEDEGGRVVGIEVKSSSAVKAADFRGIDALAEAAGDSWHRGILLHTGTQRSAFGRERYALPIESLWTLAASEVREPIPPPS